MKYRWIGLLIIVLLLTACGTAVSLTPEGDTSPLVLPTSPISPPPTPEPQSEADASIVEGLRAQVSEQLRINPEVLMLVSSERVIWRNTSLGCPQEGQSYAQVLVPGWRVVFADAAGREYDVHASEKLDTYIICQPQAEAKPTLTPQLETQGNPAVEAAKKLLAEQLGVQMDAVSVVEMEPVEWRDSCLGCAAPNEKCLMVITPGYRIVLKMGDTQYQVHTDRTGQRAIFCNQSILAPRTDK